MNSTQFRSSRPFRQKQIPSSIPSSKDIRDMFVGFQEALYSKEA
jgi:hypothetical protein